MTSPPAEAGANRTPPPMEAVAELGVVFEAYGCSPLAGRVLAHLMLADPPYLSSADLCEQLQVSQGHLSSAIQVLSMGGMIDRFGMPGTRRSHYRLSPRAFEGAMSRTVEPLNRMADFAERALLHVPDGSTAQGHLEEMRDLYRFLAERFPELGREFAARRSS